MRLVFACLAMLFPLLAVAAPVELKDKYVICNCHITPGLPWKAHSTTTAHKASHHPKAVAAQPAAPKPATAKAMYHKAPAVIQHVSYATGDGYPGSDSIVSSNKLVLPAGKSAYAPGQLVYISGRVLDSRCVPVSDAIVDIWQTNADGHYVKSTLGERLSPSPAFAGSGRATTDNLGRFNFVTIFPGAMPGRAPFIHVHVMRKDFPPLDTEMFFADDRRNVEDPVFSSLSPEQQTLLTARVWQRDVHNPDQGIGASWDISLNGRDTYRHF